MADIERAVDLIDNFLTILDEIADGPMEKHMLSKKQILAAPDIKSEEVEVPEWGGSVMVSGMTGSQRGQYMDEIMEMRGQTQTMRLQNMQVKICALCIRDEFGNRMFDDDEMADLGAKSAQAINTVATVAMRLSGIDAEAEKANVKNLGGKANGDSGSALP
jgi:chaperonin GroEL (HSP60 family)